MDRRTEDRVDRRTCTHVGDVARIRAERHDRSIVLQPDDAVRDRRRGDDVDESRAAAKGIDAGRRSGGDSAAVREFIRIDAAGCRDGLSRASDDAQPRAELVVIPDDTHPRAELVVMTDDAQPRAELVVLRRARILPRLAPLRVIEIGCPPRPYRRDAPGPVTRDRNWMPAAINPPIAHPVAAGSTDN